VAGCEREVDGGCRDRWELYDEEVSCLD
jgi:hypothetical protein